MKTQNSTQQNSSFATGPVLRFDHRMRVILVLLVIFGIIVPLTYGIVYANYVNNYDQCGDGKVSPLVCAWQKGHIGPSTDRYVEGMAPPQRAVWDGIGIGLKQQPYGPVYTYTWWVSVVDRDMHGYDFAVSVSQAITVNKEYMGDDYQIDLCSGQMPGINCSGIVTPTNPNPPQPAPWRHITVTFPYDPYTSGSGTYTKSYDYRQREFERRYGPRYGDLYANDVITSAVITLCHTKNFSDYTCLDNGIPGGDTGSLTWIKYTMIFTTNATTAGFWYANHLALSGNPWIEPLAWGPYLGAAGITGASWHVKASNLNGDGGSQDNQIDIYAGAPYPFSTTSTRPTTYGSTITATDRITIPQSPAGSADVNGTVQWYMCADTTLPFSPTEKTGLPNGCISTSSATTPNGGYTSTKVGNPVTLTVINSNCPVVQGVNNPMCSWAESPAYNVATPGYYCWLAIYNPAKNSDGLYDYAPSADTNHTDKYETSECFIVNQTNAVGLSSFRARSAGDLLLGGFSIPLVVFGFLGIVTSTAVWWFGFKRK